MTRPSASDSAAMFPSSICNGVPARAAHQTSRAKARASQLGRLDNEANVVRRRRPSNVPGRWTSGDIDLGVGIGPTNASFR